MKPTLHALRHYFRRFRIEILLFWIVSIALSVSILKGADMQVTFRLSWAEVLLVLWLVVRVAGAESVLKTTSGWNIRPLAARQLLGAGVLVLLLAIVPAFAFRGWIWQSTARPVLQDWADVLWNDFVPLLAFAIAAAWAAMTFRLLKAREASGLWVFLAAPLALGAGFLWLSKLGDEGSRSRRAFGTENLPARDHLLGVSSRIRGWETELAGRMPLEPGTLELDRRIHVEVEDVRQSGDTLRVRYALRCVGALPRRDQFAFMIRYADGSYAATANFEGFTSWKKHLLFQVSELGGEATFLSPLSVPWSHLAPDRLTEGAELWVFRMKGERLFPALEKMDSEKLRMGIASLELAHTNIGDEAWWGNLRRLGSSRPELLLKWPTWSDRVWANLVEPVLKERHTFAEENELIRHRLQTDARLAPMMASWPTALKPVLSQRLEDGRPFDSKNLLLALHDRDFTWSGDFENGLLRVRNWDSDLTGELTGKWHPQFEEFLKVKWLSNGGSGNAPATNELAKFAAARGDFDALRFLARANDVERLKTLVAFPVVDPVGWLAENSRKLVYDPEQRRFTVP
ncbi:MAG TPA: hypothetical protein VM511_03405 [Luteolibacter sp.]|nr:hypothetical protein [Luteolibacter sp.]